MRHIWVPLWSLWAKPPSHIRRRNAEVGMVVEIVILRPVTVLGVIEVCEVAKIWWVIEVGWVIEIWSIIEIRRPTGMARGRWSDRTWREKWTHKVWWFG